MNHERILEHFASRVLALGVTGVTKSDIHLPNRKFERNDRDLWFEISVGEGEPLNWTEESDRRLITVNVITAVPTGSGTSRLNNIAEKVSRLYSPAVSGRAGFVIEDSRFDVRSVSKYPADNSTEGTKINVRFVLDKITKEL